VSARWALAPIAAVSVLSQAAAAQPRADDRSALVVTFEPEAARLAPPAAVRDAIARDLGAQALAAQPAPPARARGVLMVAVDGGRLVLTFRDAAGNEIQRAIAAAGDPAANVELITLIGGNLVRDEAAELIAELSPARALVAAPERAAPTTPEPELIISRSRPGGRPERARGLTVGAEAYLSSRSAERIYSPSSGLFVARALGPHLALGVNNLLITSTEGQTVLSGGPFVEGSSFASRWLHLFGQAGVPLQARWGGPSPGGLGVQPYLGAGVRAWLGGRFSIGVGARAARVASSVFAAPPAALTRGTVSVSGGLEVGLRL
jgi:hypothetical protein